LALVRFVHLFPFQAVEGDVAGKVGGKVYSMQMSDCLMVRRTSASTRTRPSKLLSSAPRDGDEKRLCARMA
jgi:hypothetical protein